MKTVNISGINIAILDKKEVLKKIEGFLTSRGQHHIPTLNPEILLAAKKDEEFFHILNKADLTLADGTGLKLASWLLGKNIKRVTGADLVKDILRLAQTKNLGVAILNWNRGLSGKEDIARALEKKYSGLRFSVENINREGQIPESVASSLNKFSPDILFLTLGAPFQEKFIYHNLSKLSSVKIALGVGGAFDFLTSKIKRAPKLMRLLGLEWFWRLLKQPWRWRRIYNAVFVFSWRFFRWRFIKPFFYRSNVVCLLYKKEGDNYKILLVKRIQRKNHWQLPQGGTDGESIKDAGGRELKEELNTNKFRVVKTYKNLWRYEFGRDLSKYGVRSKLIWGYKGQKQSLALAKFLGKDKDIKINFWEHKNWKWINAKDLTNEVHPMRQEANKIFLDKFNELTK